MIVRSKRPSHYTVIPNLILNDSSLDWKELGLLVYLLSKPDEWSVSVAHLIKQKKAKREAILNMLKALINAGYIERKNKGEGGVDYIIFDTPHNRKTPQRENPIVDKEETATIGKPHSGETPQSGNQHLVNTDIRLVNTDKNKVTVTFDDFYTNYPKKLKRKDAKLKWDRLTTEKQQLAFDGIDKFTANKEKQFICAPDVYLNGERWDDEETEAGNATHKQNNRQDRQSAYLDELANA